MLSSLAKIILPLITIMLLGFAETSQAFTVSGTITNGTASTGRLYVMLADSNGNSTGYATSIAGVTASQANISYTIRGVRQGDFQVQAFLDTRNTGHPYGGSPIGGSNTFNISTSDVTVPLFSVAAQTGFPDPTIWWTNRNVMAMPMAGAALVRWDTPNYNNIEIANSYDLCWGTNSVPTSTTHTGGGCVSDIPSADDGNRMVTGLTNGTTYYFNVIAKLGSLTASKVTSVQVGALPNDATHHAVTVNVALSALPPAVPLMVVLMSDTGGYGTLVLSPPASTFLTATIPGVPDGTYRVKAILDANGNSRYDVGDLSNPDGDYNAAMVTVSGADTTAPTVMINTTANLQSNVTSEIQYNGQTVNSYALDFWADQQLKRAAHIVIDANPSQGLNETTDMGFTTWGNFSLWPMITSMPERGNAYTGTVTYTDGTTDSITFTVTGVLTAPPYQTYPVGTTSGSNRTSPRLAWAPDLSGLPDGPYFYYLKINDQNYNTLWETAVPPDQLSVQYTGPSLSTNTQYTWGAYIVDAYGNRAVRWSSFIPAASNTVDVTGLSVSTMACSATSRNITITGAGFSEIAANNQVYFNNSTAVTPVAASATSLTVQLPNCSTALPNPGPLKVIASGVSAASNSIFTPTINQKYYVSDMSTTPVYLSGVNVSVLNHPSITTVTDSNGWYNLAGIPTGTPLVIHAAKIGYDSVNSAYLIKYTDSIAQTNTSRIALPTSGTITSTWGNTPGKGIVRHKVVDNNTGATLGGVVVTAYSTLFRSSSRYAVSYGATCTTGTETATDGIFCVKNIDPGDYVIVSASKAGYIFSAKTFGSFADEVDQTNIVGYVAPYITDLTSAVPTASITISGGNFNATPASNSVQFTGGQYGAVTAASTTQLTVTVPCGAQNGAITVCNNGIGQCTTSSSSFTIPAPTITSISPNPATYGDTVIISGTNFYNCWGNPGVITLSMPGSISLPYNGGDSVSINTTAPAQTTTGTITVYTSGGNVTSGVSLSVVAPVVMRALTITLTSSTYGTGKVMVTGQSDCISSPCNYSINNGTVLNLTPVPDTTSGFANWTGSCDSITNNVCKVTMNADKSLTANFSLLQLKNTSKSLYYATMLEALNGADSGNEIRAHSSLAAPSLSYNRAAVTATIKGGFDNAFATRASTDFTDIIYPLTIQNGTLILDQIIVK